MQPHLSIINLTGLGISIYAYFDKALSLPVDILAGFNAFMVGFYATMNSLSYLKVTENQKETIKYRRLKAVITGVTLPAYWAMQWAADIKAFKLEYINKSNEWYKTEHFGRHLNDNQLDDIIKEAAVQPTTNITKNK